MSRLATPLASYGPRVSPAVHEFLADGFLPMQVAGEDVEARDGRRIEAEDPAFARRVAEFPAGGAADVELAVDAAARALHGPWRRMPARERSEVLNAIADLVDANADTLAQLESLDVGKPLSGAASYDIPMTAEYFRYYAGWATKIEGNTIPGPGPDRLVYTLRQPVGVVGMIIPWNFPLMLAAWKLAPALTAGCTVVVKPAEQTSLATLYFARLVRDADLLPPGVLNVVTGYGAEAGAALVENPRVDKISFTGSREVAEQIVRAGASTLKRVTLELGGKSPNIVLPDVDPAEIGVQAASAAFLNQGENCCAGTRLYVHRDIYDDVIESVRAQADAIRLGPGLAEGTDMGPLVSAPQRERVLGYVQSARDAGGSVYEPDGDSQALAEGHYVRPTLLTDLADDAKPVREEIFGPVLAAMPFESLEEVAARANASDYGLAAGIWTRDIAKAHRLAALLEAGTVWINTYNETDPAVPFGGWKRSGIGREHGHEVLNHYLETKSVWVNLEDGSASEGGSR